MRGWGFALVIVFGAAESGWAQPVQQAQRVRPNERQVLVLGMSLSSAGEDNGEPAADVDSRFSGRQIASSLQGNLSYTPVQNKRASLGFNFSSGLQHYSEVGSAFASRQSATTLALLSFGTRLTIGVTGGYAYSPDYSLGSLFLPSGDVPTAEVSPTVSDLSVTRNPSTTYDGAVNLTYQMGARAAVTMGYTQQQTEFAKDTTPGMTNRGARGRFTYRLRKDLGVRLGYGRRSAGFALPEGESSVYVDDIDAGLDFNRTLKLAFAKNTTLSFGSGSAMTTDGGTRNFSITGTVNLDRTFGRTARARLSFDRGVRMVSGFTAPVFVDTATTSFNWAPGRVAFFASGSYAAGDEGAGDTSTGFQAWQGSTGSSVSLGRVGSLYLTYSYAERGRFGVADPQGALPAQRRHSIRVGLSTSVPLLRRLVRES